VDQVSGSEHAAQYDLIVCMEVMEHCLPDILERVLNDLRRLVKPHGTVIVSVPVEIGPTLLGKQLLRRAAALRNLGDYKYFEKYSLREFIKMLFAGKNSAIERAIYFDDSRLRTGPSHGHKGFNWRALKLVLEKKFSVERMEFSPVGWSRGYFSSQAWFICKPATKPEKPSAA
jgi:SAM-dependent methyltransferase